MKFTRAWEYWIKRHKYQHRKLSQKKMRKKWFKFIMEEGECSPLVKIGEGEFCKVGLFLGRVTNHTCHSRERGNPDSGFRLFGRNDID